MCEPVKSELQLVWYDITFQQGQTTKNTSINLKKKKKSRLCRHNASPFHAFWLIIKFSLLAVVIKAKITTCRILWELASSKPFLKKKKKGE